MSDPHSIFLVFSGVCLTIGVYFLVQLFIGWLFSEGKPVSERTPESALFTGAPVEEWTTTDIGVWRSFLKTDTGRKYLDRARSMVASSCISSCSDSMHTAHSAGTGHGMNEFLKWQLSLASEKMLESISQPTGAQVDNTSESYGQASLLEKLSP